jgi:hypothetical protein
MYRQEQTLGDLLYGRLQGSESCVRMRELFPAHTLVA